ncbi:MAG TPA: HAMP domain-containing sensor histidine kinase [Clostridia bacterium]|nr:HAMP domain-containing sensor histidine kinase [Clostridia bacterium]
MDTKLRSFSRNPAVKTIAFVLFVLLIAAQVVSLQYLRFQGPNPESLFVAKYKDSSSFEGEVSRAIAFTRDILESKVVPKKYVEFLYYINDIDNTWTNVKDASREFFARNDTAFYAYDNGNWAAGENTNPAPVVNDYYNNYDAGLKQYYTIYIAFPQSYMEQKQAAWQKNSNRLKPYIIALAFGTVLELLLLAYLAAVAGRKRGDNELHTSGLDSVYTDLQIAFIILILVVWLRIISGVPNIWRVGQGPLSTAQIFSMAYFALVTAAASTAGGLLFLSLIRKLKARRFLKHSLLYQIGYFIYDLLKSLFDGRKFEKYPLTKSLFYRQLLFICSSFLLVLTTFLLIASGNNMAILPPLLEAGILYWFIKGNRKTFDEINKGFNESLEEQMKSERMKIALITNVSHDLKTPLTSIISYADLLSNEEGLTDTARDYVKILIDKSNRLKHTVSDLFDLAKSTSGNMPVEFEKIDLKKLVEQTLADMNSDIERSGLALRTKLPEASLNITADGKKLYRVFQNVLDNALKYSLQGTRVYVELENKNGTAVATVKNTAGYEMDFTVDEIMQRFSRGDKSRTTEGSGLGLSIAESFTQVCGGDFKVEIDGDLFKVTIRFKLAQNSIPAIA